MIHLRALGMRRRPVAPGADQCASSRGASRPSGETRCDEGENAPRQGILEEPCVEKRVDDEHEKDGGEPYSEDSIVLGEDPQPPCGRHEHPDVERETEYAELCEDREGRRVGRVPAG